MCWCNLTGRCVRCQFRQCLLGAKPFVLRNPRVSAPPFHFTAFRSPGASGHAVIKDIFYVQLLNNPQVGKLFKTTNMGTQSTKLWKTLGCRSGWCPLIHSTPLSGGITVVVGCLALLAADFSWSRRFLINCNGKEFFLEVCMGLWGVM